MRRASRGACPTTGACCAAGSEPSVVDRAQALRAAIDSARVGVSGGVPHGGTSTR